MSTVIDIQTARPIVVDDVEQSEVDPLLQDLLNRMQPVMSTRTLAELLDGRDYPTLRGRLE